MKKVILLTILMLYSFNAYADDKTRVNASADEKIGVGNFDSELTCDKAREIIKSPEYENMTVLDKLEITLVSAKCLAEKHNSENQDDPVVVIVGKDQNNQANVSSKIFFDIIHVKDATHMAEACAYASAAAGLFVDELAGAVGEYSCGAYLEAAVNDDPMLIFAPMMIPGEKLTVRVLDYIGLGDDYLKAVEKAKKPLAKSIEKGKEIVKKETKNIKEGKISPADVLAPTVTIPLKLGKKLGKKLGF